ncbi:hypothetical protein TVAG_413150 [Trichomonas vaginalis G3]|uniref:Uncharacterized protein n=1 Tax=Trichomonas vaginalis (strain ATCC PRA-98 / G3) TaxID=412133 RepID=A2FY68_TRIV3|nr:leishmanolysin-like peptidase family [Trichomonas vaginalis G3]EAX90146.1 hypothetical protein TVAG_413150 [Trichomonas vaginalis G3]KAI5550120.1 leishmanolysin-like peptidase family [Trichomonas vaginalis G3]|eukprot:XP_001303076.1 hypothetical protein [Trichomonas vaginalis G3]
MVMSPSLYKHFHTARTNIPYEEIICEFRKYNRTFRILVSPYAHNFGTRHYKVEKFEGDDSSCPSGIVLENVANYTNGSESIIYNGDIGSPQSINAIGGQFGRLTDVTMAFFLDSGNYEIDWKKGRPIVYGNPDSIDGVIRKGWPISPPLTTYPEYFYDPNDPNDTISFDFNGWFYSIPNETINCSNLDNQTDFSAIDYCNAPDYYNPNNGTNWSLNQYYDRQFIRLPDYGCAKGTATIPGLTHFTNDYCSSYQCNRYTSFTLDIIVNEETQEKKIITCSEEGQTHDFKRCINSTNCYNNRTVKCPSPERFCRTREVLDSYFTSDPFQNVLFPTPRPTPAASPPPSPMMTPAATPTITIDERFQPIRITHDYRLINKTIVDNEMCNSIGESKTNVFGTHTCTENDMITTEKYRVFYETCENVRNYLQNFLRVIPRKTSITTSKHSWSNTYQGGETITNSDLHFIFHGMPIGSGYSSIQIGNTYEIPSYYTYQIHFFVDPSSIPQYPSDDSGINSTFYYSILKSILSKLTTTSPTLSHLHPKFSTTYYPNPFCSFNANGIDFKVLTTPYAHGFAKKYYGTETFEGNVTCPSGILVDSSGSPLPIIYLQDILCNGLQRDSGPYSRVTDVTMAYLLDSGNYEVDWRYAKPMIYANKDYVNGNFIPNWPLGPPASTLPKWTFFNPANESLCVGFEFNWWGCPETNNKIDCSINQNLEFCKHKDYYDPFGNEIPGKSYYSYQNNNLPVYFCDKYQAVIPGMVDNHRVYDKCGYYYCADDYSSFVIDLTTDIPSKTIYKLNCTYEGQNYSFRQTNNVYYVDRTVYCPDPQRFCRIRNDYYKSFESNPFEGFIPFATAQPTPLITPYRTNALTPKVTPYMTQVQTPHSTSQETPVFTPQITNKETPFVTNFQTPFITEFQTPVFTQKETPYETHFMTAAETPFTTAFQTPFLTNYMTPVLTPYGTMSQTQGETMFQTAFETPFYTHAHTNKETPFETPYISKFLTPFQTNAITPAETPYTTAQNTPQLTPVETPLITPQITVLKLKSDMKKYSDRSSMVELILIPVYYSLS